MTTIKAILTPQYEIALMEMPFGGYRVIFAKGVYDHTSETIWDFSVASFMFDIKLDELAGNGHH
jgi:hypothetical protein